MRSRKGSNDLFGEEKEREIGAVGAQTMGDRMRRDGALALPAALREHFGEPAYRKPAKTQMGGGGGDLDTPRRKGL